VSPAPSPVFTDRAAQALADESLAATLRTATGLLEERRAAAAAALDDGAFEALRLRARAAKFSVLGDLAGHLERFEAAAKANGAQVHWAQDAEEARAIIRGILERAAVKKAVKSKSMVTEEIELNHGLEAAGITPIETDLGEYVAQLKGEKPSHIILPIIHLTRQAVAALFRKLGVGGQPLPTDDVSGLVEAARLELRKHFETAEAGITGANFAVADQGALCIVSNEGNARFCCSLPPLHVAVLGIEKLVPDLSSLSDFLRLLARSATGQRLTVYSNLLWPGRDAGDGSGPKESHVVLLDNGRTRLLASQAAEILACIRCGACLNACPVYKAVGGHSYGGTYPGPMGSILSPGLGEREGQDLAGRARRPGPRLRLHALRRLQGRLPGEDRYPAHAALAAQPAHGPARPPQAPGLQGLGDRRLAPAPAERAAQARPCRGQLARPGRLDRSRRPSALRLDPPPPTAPPR
jgi:L-lactate dehydrogenase complex protein LldF